MNGCIYRTEENKCKQFSVGGVLSFCYLDGTCDCQIPSNADRIRAMSDEELAMFLDDVQKYNAVCKPIICEDCADCMTDLCWQCWRAWLKAPVEVDE